MNVGALVMNYSIQRALHADDYQSVGVTHTKMTNSEKQADEILVLQSIFEQNFRLLGDNQYEILVEFELPSTFIIRCGNKTASIQYLPPLSLNIHNHDEYPSEYPPSFVLSCLHFSMFRLRKLCQKLDHHPFIKGEVCVFEWVECIKRELGDELVLSQMTDDVENQIETDPRATNAYSTDHTERIFRYLFDYDRERSDERLRQKFQKCTICSEEVPGTSCIRLRQCGHYYCRPCLSSYIQLELDKGRFGQRLCCPENRCEQALLPNEIKNILQDEKLHEKYERLTLQHCLESMADFVWCPRCQQPVIGSSGDDNLAICDRCHYTFCKKCSEAYHNQTMCPRDYLLLQKIELERQRKQEEELKRIQWEREKESRRIVWEREQELKRLQWERKERDEEIERFRWEREEARRELETIYSKEFEEHAAGRAARARSSEQKYRKIVMTQAEKNAILQEVLTAERMDLLETRPCPGCNMRIEKNGGCDHMRCSRCSLDFSWSQQPEPRTHALNTFLTKSADEFTDVKTVKEELDKVAVMVEKPQEASATETQQEQNDEETEIEIDNQSTLGEALISRARHCPICKKINIKIGRDNWIVCSECLRQFCFLCEQPVSGIRHFVIKCERET